jgi:hypothetical protein
VSAPPAVAVLLPVLGRPHRVEPLLRSLTASQGVARLSPVFLVSRGDDATYREVARVEALGLAAAAWLTDWPAGPGDYARKINLGLAITNQPWVFCGADDLAFHPGWADEALAVAARASALVVGTNDLSSPRVTQGHHSTHSLVARSYALDRGCTADESPGVVLHEGYDHQFCDDELIGVARYRGVFAFASRSRVEHLHPHWRKGEMDATYRKGQRAFDADRRLSRARSRAWAPRPVALPRLTPLPRRPR